MIGLGIVAAVVIATSAAAGSSAARTAPTRVGTLATSDFRVVVTAEKGRNGSGAPTAAVRVTTSQRIGGRWRATGTHRLDGTYFWHTVTGPRAVCGLELRTTGDRPRAVVQLLVTPSIGCGPAASYPLTPRQP
jgi:hypothetical protein